MTKHNVNDLFHGPVKVLNVGLELFHEALLSQKQDVVQVDWQPAAGGNERILEILEKLKNY